MFFNIYQRVLRLYQSRSGSLFARGVEATINLSVRVLQRREQFRFPERAIGGWWWVGRFRFEVLMRWFERESVQRARTVVRPGMRVVDVGAHIGYYTRLLSELVGPEGLVLAFEPHPENFAVLQHNLSQRKYENVRLFNCAVGQRNCEMPLFISDGHSNHSLIKGYAGEESALAVRCVSLDSVLEEEGIQSIDFIKSDTEGAEPLVLAGMQGTISRSPALGMLLEVNPKALQCGDVEPDQFLQDVQDMGFHIEMIAPDEATSCIYSNILCLKGESVVS